MIHYYCLLLKQLQKYKNVIIYEMCNSVYYITSVSSSIWKSNSNLFVEISSDMQHSVNNLTRYLLS